MSVLTTERLLSDMRGTPMGVFARDLASDILREGLHWSDIPPDVDQAFCWYVLRSVAERSKNFTVRSEYERFQRGEIDAARLLYALKLAGEA